MATVQTVPDLMDEMSDLMASQPTAEQVLKYHPSESIQRRAKELLAKQNAGTITGAEQEELSQFEWAEVFMRLVKVKTREKTSVRS